MLYRVLEFFTLSVPEEFFMCLFVWVILGKTEAVKFINVIFAGIITAASFLAVFVLMYPETTQLTLIQAIALAFIIYFAYKTSYIEAIIGSLLVHLVIQVTQSSSITIGMALTRTTGKQLHSSIPLRFMLGVIPEAIVLGTCAYIFYKKKFNIFNFNCFTKKNMDKQSASKIRYLILQLVFAFVIVIINYKLFFKNINLFNDKMNFLILIMNFIIIIVFTILTINKAFKMGESIQREEQLKRQLDGREIIQNIDYLCKLIDAREYDEVKNILKSMKHEVDIDMVSNANDRGNSIK